MDWILVWETCYILLLVLVCLKVVYDTSSNTKALAYIFAVIFIPVAGIIFYFAIGGNYRKKKIYTRKLLADDRQSAKMQQSLEHLSHKAIAGGNEVVQSHKGIARLLLKENLSPLTLNNQVEVFENGEEKFPPLLKALKAAKSHIHIEYYIYEDDKIGNEIAAVLAQKAAEGVEVRFIYDDFGSKSIRKKLVPELKKSGVEAFPFYRIYFVLLANRLNYRNHRKIIIIDGREGFIGGINVSDRYINVRDRKKKKLFWRDTHLRLEGPSVHYLQHMFLCDWNFCAEQTLTPEHKFFPNLTQEELGDKYVQVAASGPDSDNPTILFAMLQAINQATKELLITTPYFIPEQGVIDALRIAAISGIKVKMLVPGKSDSRIVNAAAKSYYGTLLEAGIEIYLYEKGFVHAKTLVADKELAIVGSANMDYRSFDLNFEANAIIYDQEVGACLSKSFYEDLNFARKLDRQQWEDRAWYVQLLERTARLISPLL